VIRGFAVDPTQHRSAAEALLRRLTKQVAAYEDRRAVQAIALLVS
jgi:DNA/RNA-binding domain of Phe-tRNA-synthetase-like protein